MVFAPLLGRIPPNSGGWHRGLVSSSVAGVLNAHSLLIRVQTTALNPVPSTVREYCNLGTRYAKRVSLCTDSL